MANRMLESWMRFFARVSRAAMVDSDTRKAAAMSAWSDAADEAQRHRDARLLGQLGMADEQDQFQSLVAGEGELCLGHGGVAVRRSSAASAGRARERRAFLADGVDRDPPATVVIQADGLSGA